MRLSAKYVASFFCLVLPGIVQAQSVGQVECSRADDYVYLYSSMTTLEVRTTLQCGEQVQITGRYDRYFGVRSAKGEIGYVPMESLVLLKAKPGTKAPELKAVQPTRERTPYDAPAKPTETAASTPSSASELTLRNGTRIRVKLGKTISSASAHVGDAVDLQVAEEVIVDGVLVIPAGAAASGLVKEVEPRRRMGHGGKLAFSIESVRLRDDEKAAVRSFQENTGANNGAGAILPLSSGKDVVFTQGTEFTAYVDGDIKLKKEAFQGEKSPTAAPAPSDHKPTPPRGV